jgi:hypothetical protein
MLAATLIFATPAGGLLALAGVLPVAGFAAASARLRRGRTVLGLGSPPPDRTLVALVAVPLLVGLAAAGPALRTHVGRPVRTDAQAVFVFDTSRSMAAAAGVGDPTRLSLAKRAAIRLRHDDLQDVPAGVSSLTTQILPHLFPTLDEASFDATALQVIGIERPPPPALAFGVTGTSFQALGDLRGRGFFAPWIKMRVAILLTDGESGRYNADYLGSALAGNTPQIVTNGRIPTPPESPVELVVIRVGDSGDRVYGADGVVEAAYRPDPRAAAITAELARATAGHSFTSTQLPAAGAAIRKLLGDGRRTTRGVTVHDVALAPYVLGIGLVALCVVLWRRNLRLL